MISAEPNYLYAIDGPTGRAGAQRQGGARQTGSIVDDCDQSEWCRATAGEGSQFPNDPFLASAGSWGQPFSDLWGLFQIEAPAAWEIARGDGVIVAVVDSGLNVDHRDITANVFHAEHETPGNGIDDDGNGFIDDVSGWDFTRCVRHDASGECVEPKPPGTDISDVMGHGTHVAGTLAAVGNNGIGVIGVAPAARVMVVKGVDESGFGTTADLAEAIVYAAENGARVINASWTGPPSETMAMAIDYVTREFDAVVVAAAGNETVPLERGVAPADLPAVLAVGATTRADRSADFSNFGGPLDLVAPGGGDQGPGKQPQRSILSLLAAGSALGRECHFECRPVPGDDDCMDVEVCTVSPLVVADQYLRLSGTSMAAPHVSGVAALVRGRHPEFTRQQVRQVLVESADDLGAPGRDKFFGYGRLNARAALAVDATPVAEILTPDQSGKIWERDLPFAVGGTAASPQDALREWRLTIRREDEDEAHLVAGGVHVVADDQLGTLAPDAAWEWTPGARYVLELQVEDVAGHVAHDTRTFLMPNPRFAAVPIPDQFGEGGQALSVSGDGQQLALMRVDRNGGGTSVWLYDIGARELVRVADGSSPSLSAGGRALAYRESTSPFDLILYDVDGRTETRVPEPTLGRGQLTSLSGDATRIAFILNEDADPSVGNSDHSWEAFVYPLPAGPLRQITNGPQNRTYQFEFEIDELTQTFDGSRLAFTCRNDLDPTASTGGRRQVFLYDDTTGAVRQITGRDGGAASDCVHPTLDADGTMLACEGGGLFLADLATGRVERVADTAGRPAAPQLSADAKFLAFTAELDLDPTVGNEDLREEIFVLDLDSGTIAQVTDRKNNVRDPSAFEAMDATASVLLERLYGELNGTGLRLGPARLVERHRVSNRPPVLSAPHLVIARTGQTTRVTVTATDPDRDAVTFHVEQAARDPMPLGMLAESVVTDHGDGSADLEFTAGQSEVGAHPLRVAAFDEEGGVSVSEMQLVVSGACVGDCNDDGRVTIDELVAGVSIALGRATVERCVAVESDGDVGITIGELVRAVGAALSGCR